MRITWCACSGLMMLAACTSRSEQAVQVSGPAANVPAAGGAGVEDASAITGGSLIADTGAPDADGDGRVNDSEAPDTSIAEITCGEPRVNENPGNSCYNTAPPALKLTALLNDGDVFAPLMLASPPGDSSRLFVITRGGTVRIVKDGVLLASPFLDLTGVVASNSGTAEYGLLGIAFDPAFEMNGKVWLHYNVDGMPIDSVTSSVLASSEDPDLADPTTLTVLFTEPQPATNHNGGMLAFGQDGCLYLGFGDGGGGGDPSGFGQNTQEPMGSILRIDAATGNAAPGNPGFGDPRIWSYGLRNPWRYSFDRETGDLYIGDVGQSHWEEVDVQPAGLSGHNYGWNSWEGTHEYAGTEATGIRMPIKEYSHADTGESITGGYVYRGSAIPNLVGRYLYADFTTSRYWVLTYSGEVGGQPQICDDYEITADFAGATSPVAFGQDTRGELYVLTLNGAIYRIDPA